MGITDFFKNVRGNMASNAFWEVLPDAKSELRSLRHKEDNFDDIMQVVKNVSANEKIQKAVFLLAGEENADTHPTQRICSEMAGFYSLASSMIRDFDASNSDASLEKKKQFLSHLIEDDCARKIVDNHPGFFIMQLNSLSHNLSAGEGMEMLSFLEKESGFLPNVIQQADMGDWVAEFFDKLTANDNDEGFCAARLASSPSFHVASKDAKFLDAIHSNALLRSAVNGNNGREDELRY